MYLYVVSTKKKKKKGGAFLEFIAKEEKCLRHSISIARLLAFEIYLNTAQDNPSPPLNT